MRPVILCFESRKQNLECQQRLLQAAGYSVIAADSPEQVVALAQAYDACIALVSDDEVCGDGVPAGGVSDHERPAHFWICASLRRLRPSLKIVLQHAGLCDDGPIEADFIIPKATNPRSKLALLKQLELPKAS